MGPESKRWVWRIVTIGNQAYIENSNIGILLAKSDTTLKDSKVLVTGQQVIAFGVIVGAVFAVLSGFGS